MFFGLDNPSLTSLSTPTILRRKVYTGTSAFHVLHALIHRLERVVLLRALRSWRISHFWSCLRFATSVDLKTCHQYFILLALNSSICHHIRIYSLSFPVFIVLLEHVNFSNSALAGPVRQLRGPRVEDVNTGWLHKTVSPSGTSGICFRF
jgi:hypothetical protein